jgi:hypothetical protein
MIDAKNLNIEDIKEMDFSTLSKEDIEEIKSESMNCYTLEQSIKLIINSIYGAFANEYFHFYNIAIAETVTLQGQDAIRFTEVMVEKYFKEYFHKDKALHKAFGVSEDYDVKPIKKNVWKYTDTDSGYLIFEEVMESIGWDKPIKEFVHILNNTRLDAFIKKVLSDYANERNTENYLDFELETIAENAVWVAKKKYIQNIIWKDGKDYDHLSYIKTTGLEIIQSSTPPFCRQKLIDIMMFIFSKKKLSVKDNGELVRLIKEVKREFKLANIEKISMSRSISNYRKFVLNDQDSLDLQSGCPIHVRAGSFHNYLLNQNPKLKGKYQLIQGGDKVKWYHCDDPFQTVFAYKVGSYPVEIAPKMNFEMQFQKTVLDPLNRIIVPAGLPALNPSLAYTISLF